MDQPRHSPPADDPSFLASLAELKQGLDHPAASAASESDSVQQVASLTTSSTGADRASRRERPLLELFPPALLMRERAPGPAIAGAPPPRIGRSRFAAPLESAVPSDGPLTYEAFYGLNEKPFSLSPDPRFIYHSTSRDRVTQELVDAFGHGDRVMLLTGEMGTGKTTLCRSLASELGSRTVTSFVAEPAASIDDLLKAVLIDFGVISRADATRGRLATATRQELTSAIGDFAASLAPLQASAVIIIDEAQSVPAGVLALLSDLPEAGDDRRVQIVLVGQPALLPFLRRRQLRALDRRIAVRCRLEPLAPDEMIGYVMHRLAVAGASARVEFDNGAIAELYAATRGVPRLVNLVCDRALTRGHEASASVIDDRLVAAAAADLDLVPLKSDARRIARTLAMGLLFILLMLAGAAAAMWVFRDDLSRAFPGLTSFPGFPRLRRL